jgi:hypothetical protein
MTLLQQSVHLWMQHPRAPSQLHSLTHPGLPGEQTIHEQSPMADCAVLGTTKPRAKMPKSRRRRVTELVIACFSQECFNYSNVAKTSQALGGFREPDERIVPWNERPAGPWMRCAGLNERSRIAGDQLRNSNAPVLTLERRSASLRCPLPRVQLLADRRASPRAPRASEVWWRRAKRGAGRLAACPTRAAHRAGRTEPRAEAGGRCPG